MLHLPRWGLMGVFLKGNLYGYKEGLDLLM